MLLNNIQTELTFACRTFGRHNPSSLVKFRAMSSKEALRKTISKAVKCLDNVTLKTQSDAVAHKLRQLDAYKQAKRIAIYMNMDSGELKTDLMISHAFNDGKRVFLPNITSLGPHDRKYFPNQKRHLRMLEVSSHNDVLNLLPRGKYKLKEPIDGYDCLSDREGLDLIIVPGVGFTSACHRIGHGGAFYDSYIQEHRAIAGNVPFLIGVGLSAQLVDNDVLPIEDHDYILDQVIIGNDVYCK